MTDYFSISMLGTLLYVVAFFLAYLISDKVLFREIDFIKELKGGNLAVAITIAGFAVGLAIVIPKG